MTELSPAAKAVLDAANGCSCYGPDDCLNESRWIAAGALRAAADQVVPEEPMCLYDQRWMYERDTRQFIRSKLLVIVAELRGTNPTNQKDN